jgi:NTE family protein
MRSISRAVATILLLAAAFCAAGCAHYPENPSLATINTNAGYRYSVVREEPAADKPFVLLSFSGGGTRAAAFAFGLMEELRMVEYSSPGGVKRKLLDDVEIISSVSGGSFTSAYYALFPDDFFTNFPKQFLYRNVQGALIARLFNPYNWFRLAFPDFSRIDMADEYYNKTIFERKTFADLIKRQRGSAPFLVLNATDIGITHRFEFTQDQFDLLCSDLSGVRVSRAVAASSNFPVAFPPMTIDIHKQNCGPVPIWIDAAMKDPDLNRRKTDALAALSYRASDRLYAHLLDGGISDNLGLRGPYQAVTTTDSAWSILTQIDRKHLKQLMVVAANAKTTKHSDWDAKSNPPGITKVLGVVMNGPMDDVSFDSVENAERQFAYMKQLSETVNACNDLLKGCPAVKPIRNPITTDFTFAELSFDKIPDPRLRRCLQELPTSFYLPHETVDLLRMAAAQLLMTSDSFIKGMQELDPAWRPRTVVIDGKLVDVVCGVQR